MARIKASQTTSRARVRRYQKPKSSALSEVHPYKVVGDPAQILTEMKKLPDGVTVAFIPSDAAVERKLLQLGSGRLQRFGRFLVESQARPAVRKRFRSSQAVKKPVMDKTAFEPSSRAKALLKGVQIAQDDLKDSGGAYDLEQVRSLLNGISRQMIDRKVREGSLLAVPGPSNRRAYPTVQFNRDGTVVPGLKAVYDALPTGNPWAVLNFLVRPDPRLSGRKPIDLLKSGDVDLAVEAARRAGQQGS
jgi:hypothetical protein